LPYGSGLSAQLGLKTESVVGTEITVDKFYEFLPPESIAYVPTYTDSAGLRAGQAFKRGSRTAITAHDVSGDWALEHADRGIIATGGGMGLIWKHALGSPITVPTLIASGAYKQIHVPGPRTGLSQTIQVGRPQTDGVVKAHTYRGVKYTGWEFTCNDGELATLKLSVDGWQEATATALAVAAFPSAAQIFGFADASNFKLGGTATTSAGETTVASGVAVATVVTGLTITAQTPLAAGRRGLGNAGVKREQIENGIPVISGKLAGEYTSQSEFYSLIKSGASTVMQIDFTHGDAGGGNPFLLSFILPAVKFKEGGPQVGGPDIVGQDINFEAYDDGSGTNPVIQVKLISTDQQL
jgi:Phage tail tube protein